ncbi:DUF1622 domain-containing protein [Pontibacter sp. BT310]|jgi:uncharacterized membrane protein|uniref:DUF1622 domain-containing protein n=1 Tax=Pontibacter populi TaxID=890055 RepID=A0ABS6XBG5_9BACT|nr:MULTISPECIES: DUF1622 domain-containing protein [Pontibacter]MBJ6118398.1 DUF1622 domain-containing protein [Pontibacter sp. BT310]MBR0570826.1 DUF1622 domain-containing protein [Microvirga sp. STS03]MBW3365252.1 DUF1622 domain-containing protein [Pontibacter populi]
MEIVRTYIEYVVGIIEAIGVLIISVGAAIALVRYLFPMLTGKTYYKELRQDLGKTILLGLEILVAADIIATVSTKPDLQGVLILGMIILIRTFLSISLQVELEGKFPWKNEDPKL